MSEPLRSRHECRWTWRTLPWVLAWGLLLAFAGAARAQSGGIPGYPDTIWSYDPREVSILPRYCNHALLFRDVVPGGNNPEQIAAWQEVLGPTMRHIHHYCWGMMKTHRAIFLAVGQREREIYLRGAVPEFDYVIDRAAETFVLLPEVLLKRADTLIRLGEGPRAVLDLERSISIKPDYWPAYARMADYYKETGHSNKAREWLQKGLEKAPDAAGLKRRLAELGSKK